MFIFAVLLTWRNEIWPFIELLRKSYLFAQLFFSSVRGRKRIVLTIILVISSIYVTIYSIKAKLVANFFIFEDEEGKIWWRTTPSGSLFPWPIKSGMLEALSEVKIIDSIIYRDFIKTQILFGLVILLWIITILLILKSHILS
jgi:hypothetical protein